MATPPSQSVFDALAAGSSSKGSWADRIKSVDKPTVPLPVDAPTQSSTSASSKSAKPASRSKSTPASAPVSASGGDDGEWQQVTGKPVVRRQAGDAKQGQSQGSASRDWRDRPSDEAGDVKLKGAKRAGGKKLAEETVESVAESGDKAETSTAPVAESSAVAKTAASEAAADSAPSKAPAPAPVVKTAAPAVNPWAARREQMQAAPPASLASSSAPKSNGLAPKKALAPKPNGTPTTSSAKKVGKGQTPPVVTDDNAWPDVAKAAEALKASEKEKERKIKADEAEAAAAAVSSQAGKKQKWMAIPAVELQAAADKAAENARRQAKADQPRKKTTRNDGEESSPSRPSTRPSSRKPSISSPTKKGARLPGVAGQKKNKDGSKPVFGTVSPTTTSDVSDVDAASRRSNAGSVLGLDNVGGVKAEAGGSSLSRQVSRHSLPSSPAVEQGVADSHDELRNARGVNGSSSNRGRGRHDGGRGYGGRGRGGYRNGHMPGGPRSAYVSPNFANGQLPPDAAYGDYAYAYGFAPGHPYGGAYPLQIGGRAMPPPPMPVTQVPGLDFLRICLLGQVEYYFGMQNLAMDFFLRQQMDSEGWIDISMISSFNRVKSLTPDVALVREMMQLSSILEVKEDCVRLSGGEAKRWVLPDAKQSTIQSDPDERQIENGGEAVLGVPEDSAERWSAPNGGVESALLKSVPVSSAVSVDDSDAVKEDTPATSMSDDHAEDREEMEMKTIGAAVDALTAQQ